MEEEEISLGEILAILKQRWGRIVLWSMGGLLVAALYTFFFVTPMYQSTSKIVVNQTQNTNQVLTNTDIQTNVSLISTYQSIIKEPIILEHVLVTADSDLTLEELREKITVETQDESLVFGVTVSDESPYVAAELANATAHSFEENIGNILEVQNVTILSEAVANPNPVSPNVPLNLVLGVLVGMMIGIGLAFLAEFMDKTVKDDKFIESIGWTNLGSVFEMSEAEVKETRYMPESRKISTRAAQRRV